MLFYTSEYEKYINVSFGVDSTDKALREARDNPQNYDEGELLDLQNAAYYDISVYDKNGKCLDNFSVNYGEANLDEIAVDLAQEYFDMPNITDLEEINDFDYEEDIVEYIQNESSTEQSLADQIQTANSEKQEFSTTDTKTKENIIE